MGSLVYPTMFELVLAVAAAVLTCLLALLYLRRVRLARPPIGTFNRRDIAILFVFLTGLPFLYVVFPQELLTGFLILTFSSALAIGYRPLFRASTLWLIIGLLVGVNIWMARTILGTVVGWQIYWLETDILVVAAAVAVSNLYVQGGMRLVHVAWFGVILAGYDAVFTLVWPITNELAERFLGYPLDPSFGFRENIFNASLGIGDLLVYCLFVIAAYKAYGWVGAKLGLAITVVFGAVIPALAPLLFSVLIDARTDLVVPAQTAFGPAAYLSYRWLRRKYGPERTMKQFLASADVPQPVAEAAEPAKLPAPAPA